MITFLFLRLDFGTRIRFALGGMTTAKRPVAITIIAVWVMISGVLGALFLAQYFAPDSSLAFTDPVAIGLSGIGAVLFLLAGGELLRMHKRGLYALLAATASRIVLLSVHEQNVRGGRGAPSVGRRKTVYRVRRAFYSLANQSGGEAALDGGFWND